LNLSFLLFGGPLFTPLGCKSKETVGLEIEIQWNVEETERWRNKVFVSQVDDAGIGRQEWGGWVE